MCGIAGLIQLDGSPVLPEILKRMTDAIAHRGPDGEGQWIEGGVGIGHRRLSIIDLSEAGHQPMASGNGRYVLSYNGELYNFRELRRQLEQQGYGFRSQCDTEVVLHALVAWGPDALRRFNGMFALALWDRESRTLLLARDRYGIKPLYYARAGRTFAFGSEQKAILASCALERWLDRAALFEYFTFQNFFTDRTLLKDLHTLPAGTFGTLNLRADGALKIERYWDFDFTEPSGPVDPREYREELDRLFVQAVERQLVADVEVGSYLSGGIDSGSITSVASRSIGNLKTFTCGFDLSSASGFELAFDERQQAEAMSARFKTEHYEIVLKAGDMERSLPAVARHLEEPRVGQSYPNYYVARLAGKFVKVVLSGSGGDELFGGYPWRYYRAAVSTDFEHYIDQYYAYWQRLADDATLRRLFAPIWADVAGVRTRDIFRDVFERRDEKLDRPEDYINHSLYFEAKTFLHGLLMVEDKLSMAHGLETRVPFLDNDLVDFAMRCPVGLKLNNLAEVLRLNENDPGNKSEVHFQRTSDGKQILRDIARNHVPANVVEGIKQGFSAPDASWFKGESIDFVRRILVESTPRLGEVMDLAVMRELVNEHLDGEQNRRLFIWSLLNLEHWLDSQIGTHPV